MNKYDDWIYNIGDRIVKENLDITIINRRSTIKGREYQYICNKCGYDSSKPQYVRGEYRKELWFPTSKIKAKCNCGCCESKTPIIVQPGINDINTTDPWMTKYFVNKEDALRLTHSSGKRVPMKCPDCDANEKNYIVQKLYEAGHLPCRCNDYTSMPNKISYYIFSTLLNKLDYYEAEYSPDWSGRYKYDNYFIYHGLSYIVEMDGELGHGNVTFRRKKDVIGYKRDLIKNNLAEKHNIKLIRIDCINKDHYKIAKELCGVLESIIEQPINVDYKTMLEFVSKNIMKEVCTYYNNHPNAKRKEFEKLFRIGSAGILHYLKLGTELGWCNYVLPKDRREEIKENVIKFKNEHIEYSPNDIAKVFGLNEAYVYNLLKEGSKEGICVYQTDEEIKIAKARNGKITSDRNSKTVYVYDERKNYMGSYKNSVVLQNNSINDFGVYLISQNIRHACTSETHKYKNYYFYEYKLA